MRAPDGVRRMVKRPRPRTPGSVSHTSFLLDLALLVATSISRVVITPARPTPDRRVRSDAAPAASVAVSDAGAVVSTYPSVDPIFGSDTAPVCCRFSQDRPKRYGTLPDKI